MQQVSVLETNIGSSTTGNSANQQIIFNDAGVLRGDADLTFNTALNLLTVTNLDVSAAATITGNLTVATSGFKVDSLTGRIAVNTTTFATGAIGVIQSSATRWAGFNLNNSAGNLGGTIGLDASGSGGGSQDLSILAVGTNLSLYSGNNLQFKISNPGVFNWYDGAGGTRMTLNSTGLGVGTSPSYKLDVSVNSIDGFRLKNTVAASAYSNRFHVSNDTGIGFIGHGPSYVGGTTFGVGANGHVIYCDAAGPLAVGTTTAQSLWLVTNETVRATLKSTGQLRFVPLAADPAGAEAGDVYYNSTSNKLKCYNGTTWNDLF